MERDYAGLEQDITAHSLGKISSAPEKKGNQLSGPEGRPCLHRRECGAGREGSPGPLVQGTKGQGRLRTDGSEPTAGHVSSVNLEPMGLATSKHHR